MHAGPWADLRLLVLFFTAGVLGVHALEQLPATAWLAALLLPAIPRSRLRLPLLAAAAGAALTAASASNLLEQRWPEHLHATDRWVQGTVASLPEFHALGASGNWRFLFEPLADDMPTRIRVGWYRSDEQLRGGECWWLQLRLRTPHGSFNPAGFDYEGWLFGQGIGATGTVRGAQRCDPQPGHAILRWRQDIADAVRGVVGQRPALGLVLALTLGDRSAFNDRDWDVFRATGTTHLVAISGFNIAIVAGFAFFLFRWSWSAWPRLCLLVPAQRIGLLGSAVMAGFYAFIAGFEPPVARAVLMCWLVLVAVWTHRIRQPSRVLALAWLLILVLDPSAVLSAGLWLSFAAVGAIFYVSLGRLRPPGWWHAAVSLQLILALALAPVAVLFFHGTSWLAPLVNLLAVPAFTVLTPWALAAVLLLLASPGLGVPLLESAAWALDRVAAGLELAAQLPGLWLPASPPPSLIALALLGAVLVLVPRGVPLRHLGLLCLVPLLSALPAVPRGGFEVSVLDVGQGLSVLVQTEHHALLYDAGPAYDEGFDAGESVVAPYVLGRGLRELDRLLLSHGDNDHAGGVDSVRRLLQVEAELGTHGQPACAQGEAWEWDGVRFEVLHPDGSGFAGNNASCVLLVEGPFRVLLAGDVEAAAEARLLRDRPGDLAADLLVAPHHGSKTSSTEDFVRAVNPEVVVYGAGWRHHFRHPRPEVVARYRQIGARQFTTGNSGALQVWKSGDGLQVREYRREAARFWNAAAESVE